MIVFFLKTAKKQLTHLKKATCAKRLFLFFYNVIFYPLYPHYPHINLSKGLGIWGYFQIENCML